ncbi:MAG TPA: ubiquitin-like protein UBact [Candidatus Latescibacteria bacterium]|nr:ubiquitin-like protein UBact [Gemmatimonadota bacterium]HCR18334.1 ubiquitin-like protein UBact [Candidatus Latescibacterota bacterium]
MVKDSVDFERRTRRVGPKDGVPNDGDEGPSRPDVDRPDTQDLLRRMRRVDPNQARRYRQRTGE